ncbi:hypothetical protein pb186bvf_003788 [Paramecium bursaria]
MENFNIIMPIIHMCVCCFVNYEPHFQSLHEIFDLRFAIVAKQLLSKIQFHFQRKFLDHQGFLKMVFELLYDKFFTCSQNSTFTFSDHFLDISQGLTAPQKSEL